MDKCTLGAAAMEVAAKIAAWRFRTNPDRETLVSDSQSLAWEMAQTAGEKATPGAVAKFAVRRVCEGRQFQQSTSSIDGPGRQPGRPQRVGFDPAAVFSDRDDPARIVALRLDLRAWLETLTNRRRAIALMLATGEEPGKVADCFGSTYMALAQCRHHLKKTWQAFQT